MANLVIKIGGSLLFNEDGSINDSIVVDYVSAIEEIKDDFDKIILIVGGGKIAREFVRAGNAIKASQSQADLLGTYGARLNALLFCSAMDDANPLPPTSFEELIQMIERE